MRDKETFGLRAVLLLLLIPLLGAKGGCGVALEEETASLNCTDAVPTRISAFAGGVAQSCDQRASLSFFPSTLEGNITVTVSIPAGVPTGNVGRAYRFQVTSGVFQLGLETAQPSHPIIQIAVPDDGTDTAELELGVLVGNVWTPAPNSGVNGGSGEVVGQFLDPFLNPVVGILHTGGGADKMPPEPPEIKSVTRLPNAGGVRIEWLASPSLDVSQYLILRFGLTLDSVPVSQTAYTDRSATSLNSSYCYQVDARDVAGNKSSDLYGPPAQLCTNP